MPARLPLRRLARLLPALCACSALLAAQPCAAQQSGEVRYDFRERIFTPVTARQGMVASDQALATQAGVRILQRGGNAVDAAVAVGFALAVVLPNAGNLGGGGFMLIHDAAGGREIVLDFRETAPARARAGMFLTPGGDVEAGKSLYTHLAVGVPGTVAGLVHAQRKFGKLPLAAVVAPAIDLARKGFRVSPTLAEVLQVERENLGRWPASRAVFFKEVRQALPCSQPPCAESTTSEPLAAGDLLVQPDLANSLQAIARDGAEAFYEGEIGRLIAAEAARHGGLLTREDLRAYRAVEREPVSGEYRGLRVTSMPPPSSGGVHIVQMLNLLQRYPLSDYGAGSAQALHLMAEAMKLAYADRSRWLGDPDHADVPAAGLTSPAYADELARGIDPQRATPADRIAPGNPLPYESPQTTHYSVADAAGNAVSTTYTLNLNFGSGIVAAGTGILLNNEMDDFSAKPGAANAYGLTGGEANAIAPGKRPLSSMSPTIVYRDGKPWLVTGSPGGARIISTVLQAVVNAVDFGMNPAESAAMPRIHHQWTPDYLRVERGLSPDTTRLLAQMGHDVRVMPTMGSTQTIQIEEGRFQGASDPRNPDGLTAGY